jgi:hypothetical protein
VHKNVQQTISHTDIGVKTSNDGNVNQVCGKTRQNKWKMKGGLAMAKRPASRPPNEQGEEPTSAEVVTTVVLNSVLQWIVPIHNTLYSGQKGNCFATFFAVLL